MDQATPFYNKIKHYSKQFLFIGKLGNTLWTISMHDVSCTIAS